MWQQIEIHTLKLPAVWHFSHTNAPNSFSFLFSVKYFLLFVSILEKCGQEKKKRIIFVSWSWSPHLHCKSCRLQRRTVGDWWVSNAPSRFAWLDQTLDGLHWRCCPTRTEPRLPDSSRVIPSKADKKSTPGRLVHFRRSTAVRRGVSSQMCWW